MLAFLSRLSGPPLRRFRIRGKTSRPHLNGWVDAHADEAVQVIGKGPWTRQLLRGLEQERPHVDLTVNHAGEWEAIINKHLAPNPAVVCTRLSRDAPTSAS